MQGPGGIACHLDEVAVCARRRITPAIGDHQAFIILLVAHLGDWDGGGGVITWLRIGECHRREDYLNEKNSEGKGSSGHVLHLQEHKHCWVLAALLSGCGIGFHSVVQNSQLV